VSTKKNSFVIRADGPSPVSFTLRTASRGRRRARSADADVRLWTTTDERSSASRSRRSRIRALGARWSGRASRCTPVLSIVAFVPRRSNIVKIVQNN